jgi:hypothetical protein
MEQALINPEVLNPSQLDRSAFALTVHNPAKSYVATRNNGNE